MIVREYFMFLVSDVEHVEHRKYHPWPHLRIRNKVNPMYLYAVHLIIDITMFLAVSLA